MMNGTVYAYAVTLFSTGIPVPVTIRERPTVVYTQTLTKTL
jgi:hypothetical protein